MDSISDLRNKISLNPIKVIDDLTELIKLNCEYSLNYALRAEAYMHIQDYNKAIDDLTKALDIEKNIKFMPDYNINEVLSRYYGTRAVAYMGMENYEDAITDLTKAINLKNYFYYKDRAISYAHLSTKCNDEKKLHYLFLVIRDFNKFSKLNYEADPFLIFFASSAYEQFANYNLKNNRYYKAIRCFNKAIKINPEDTELHLNRASACESYSITRNSKEMDYSENINFINILNKIISSNELPYFFPSKSFYVGIRGSCYYDIKNYKEAIPDFTNRIEYIDQYYHLKDKFKKEGSSRVLVESNIGCII